MPRHIIWKTTTQLIALRPQSRHSRVYKTNRRLLQKHQSLNELQSRKSNDNFIAIQIVVNLLEVLEVLEKVQQTVKNLKATKNSTFIQSNE